MLKNQSIGNKLIAAFLLVGIVPLAAVGVLSYLQGKDAIEEQVFSQLLAIREIKKSQIEDYFEDIKSQVITLSEDKMTIEAMKEFTEAYPALGDGDWDDAKNAAQKLYIYDNPNPTGEKDLLDYASDGSRYSELHAKYHPIFRNYLNKFGYYDIFLVNADNGYIEYTVYKELDYGTSLLTGKYTSANIAKVFNTVKNNGNTEETSFDDFEPYAPSNGYPAAFIASPIVDEGETIGVLIFQMPLGRINAIMGKRAGLGETGETYLIGSDKLMRSDSFLDPVNHTVEASFANPVLGNVDTEASRDALAGNADVRTITDYNGNPVLSAYTPIELFGVRWALLAEIDEAEALAPVIALRNWILFGGLILALLAGVFGFFTSRTITNPILNLFGWVDDIITEMEGGHGDLTKVFPVDSKDEIGQLGGLFNKFVAKLHEVILLVKNNSQEVASAATEIASAAEQSAAGATEQTAQTGEVATSVEQMTATILESSQNATQAAESAQKAAEVANTGGEIVKQTVAGMNAIASSVSESAKTISELGARSDEIGEIIGVIDDIADQTNLLALNAAIEAARAGEQGRGFAVVADEVRKLAERTTKATSEIATMIKNIQSDTKDAVASMEEGTLKVEEGLEFAGQAGEALDEIVSVVSEVQDMIGLIATASEEQSAAAEQISGNVGGIASVAQQTAQGSEQMAAASEQLNRQTESLMLVVNQFKLNGHTVTESV